MSQAVETMRLPHSGPALGRRQIAAILAIELRKNLLGRWALPMYFLASMPVAAMAIRALVALIAPEQIPGANNIGAASQFFSGVFQGFAVRFVIFFGCVAVFTNLFRGEVVDKSLHYYLLAPLRRDVLAVGKYLSGVLSTAIVFTGMTVTSYLLMYLPSPQFVGSYLLGGPGLSHLVSYVGITWLACIGYGAVFMLLGLLFRNPVVPAVLVFGLEFINAMLPSLLKKISVIYYLHSLAPVPIDLGPFALVGDPISPWVAVPGVMLVSAALLAASSLFVRNMEVQYGSD